MTIRIKFALPSLILCLAWAAFGATPERPATWSSALHVPHLKNAFQLDARLYRCAQPSRGGFSEAKRLGITDVLDLRGGRIDELAAKRSGLVLHKFNLNAGKVSEEEILQALQIIRSCKGPVLVHCWHGSDRTGAVCAAYRLVFNNWSKEEALKEMLDGGFGFHRRYANLTRLIREVDTDKLKLAVFGPQQYQSTSN